MSSSNTMAVATPGAADAPSAAAGLVSENVSAWFGDHKVLHRVNLEMQANQVTSLIGPSGCGKSTFLRILNRMHELVPSASLALGGGEWATVRRIILPTARTGLLTAVILGIARVVGETAPLLITSLGNPYFNSNPFKGKQDALPLMIYRLVRLPQSAEIQRAWTGALVLLGLVLILFIIARIVGGRGPGHIGRFKRAQLARKGLS